MGGRPVTSDAPNGHLGQGSRDSLTGGCWQVRMREPGHTPRSAHPRPLAPHRPHTDVQRQEPPSLGSQRFSTTKASVVGHPKSIPTWAIMQLTLVQPPGPVSSPPRGKVSSSGRGTGQPGPGGLYSLWPAVPRGKVPREPTVNGLFIPFDFTSSERGSLSP